MRADRRLLPSMLVVALGPFLAACPGDAIEKMWQYRSHAASYSSPAVSHNLVVFGTTAGELHALSRDGAFQWKFQTRKEIVSSPEIMDNLIFFGSTNHNFYAVDLRGRQTWKYTTFSRVKGDPTVDPASKTVYFGSYDKHVYALDAVTRAERWVFPPQPEEDEPEQEDGSVEEAPAPAAEGAAAVAAPKPDTSRWPTDAFSYAQPTLTSNGLLVLGNLDGHLYAIDKVTGDLKWRWGEGSQAARRRGITSTVLEHEGVLYFGANDGKVHAIKLSDQSEVWTFETGGEVNSSPVMDQSGTVYVGSLDKKLYALDGKTGEKKWELELGGPLVAAPALYQDKLVLIGGGEGDGHIYAVNAADGKIFWKYKTGDKIEADVYVDDDRFYVASGDKHLYAFKINKLP